MPFSWKCFLASAGGGVGCRARRAWPATTSSRRSLTRARRPSRGSPTPTGQVSFTSGAGGVFTLGSSCTSRRRTAGRRAARCSSSPLRRVLRRSRRRRSRRAMPAMRATSRAAAGTVFGSAALIERQETAVARSCAARCRRAGAELTPSGVGVTLNVVVPGTVTGEPRGRSKAASTALPVSLPAAAARPPQQRRPGRGRQRPVACRERLRLDASRQPAAAAAHRRDCCRETQEAKAKTRLIASLKQAPRQRRRRRSS